MTAEEYSSAAAQGNRVLSGFLAAAATITPDGDNYRFLVAVTHLGETFPHYRTVSVIRRDRTIEQHEMLLRLLAAGKFLYQLNSKRATI